MFRKKLTDKKIKAVHDKAIDAPDSDKALEILSPLIEAQASNDLAADALIDIVKRGTLTIEQSLDVLYDIY